MSVPQRAPFGADGRHDVYRYVPPEQVIARATTYIEDVLIEFALTFSGSLLVTGPDGDVTAAEHRPDLQLAGAALHRIADGLFISAVRTDEPRLESSGGHRFTHIGSSLTGPRTRRFTGRCTIELAGGTGADEPEVSGSLDYALDVTAGAPSDPPPTGGPQWSERHERSLASIGAVVLAPVPVAADRAARLYPV